MKRAVFGRVVLSVVVLQTGACADSVTGPRPTPPAATTPAAPPAPPAPPSPPISDDAFPAVLRPARVFGSPSQVAPFPLTPTAQASRIVLYDDRTFAIQFAPRPGWAFEYTGTYSESDDLIQLRFDAWPQGSAVGSLSDRSLTIRYNAYLQMTDFEDAVYTLTGVVGPTAAGASR